MSLNELISNFNELCSVDDLDEYSILKNAQLVKISGNIDECHVILNDTIKRYNRYLANIKNWKQFNYIRDSLVLFLSLPHNSFPLLMDKLVLMKKIDYDLYNTVCEFHGIESDESDSDDDYY
jgi:hypothetical protein